MTTNLQNFGHAVRRQREKLGLTQLEIAARGGPSNTTQTKIENGEPPAPSNATLRKIDAGFRWPAGSARRLLTGAREPIAPARIEQALRVQLSTLSDLTDTDDPVSRLKFIRSQLDRVIQQLEGERHYEAQEPGKKASGQEQRGAGRGEEGPPPMTPDELAAWRDRHNLVTPRDSELLGAALSPEQKVTGDALREAERIAERESVKERDSDGGQRDSADVAEPVEDPRRED